MSENVTENRSFKTKSIAELAGAINNSTFRRFGFVKSDILIHWKEIVGAVLAKSSLPERLIMPKHNEYDGIRAGTLHIRVEGSFAPEMQHLEPLVIDRINSYYGYKAIEKLVFHHGMINPVPEKKKYQKPILNDSQKSELDSLLKNIKDDKLRKSLLRLGRS
ncbi:MAG: DciA family protein [Emcibacteraceae bacterium]